MANSDLTGFPYLLPGDAPDIAGITLAMAMWADSGDVLLQATDEADRDARYSDVPAPALVVSKSRPAVWLKVGDTGTSADWRTVWSDTGWVTTGFVTTSNLNITIAQVRRIGAQVTLFISGVMNTDIGPATATGIHAGNIVGDPTLITVPAGFRPDVERRCVSATSYATWGTRVAIDGTVSIADGAPGAQMSTGDNFGMYVQYIAAGE